jgi:pyruvate dehydrogenase E2 component (dihydrolipoamide acetyltransferase)
VKAEDSLITLESDKATMDVPSPVSGVVREMKLKVGDKVAEGTLVAIVESGAQASASASAPASAPAAPAPSAAAPVPSANAASSAASSVEVRVPDIGDFKDVPIIELLVKVGDSIKAEDSLMTLESDKATMDIPSPVSGVVTELKVQVGDKVAEGVVLALVRVPGGTQSAGAGAGTTAPAAAAPALAPVAASVPSVAAEPAPAAATMPAAAAVADIRPTPPSRSLHRCASRCRRRAAPAGRGGPRQPLGAPLCARTRRRCGEGRRHRPKGRILQADIQAYVKGVLSARRRRRLPQLHRVVVLICCPGRRSTSAKFGPSRSSRCRASRRSPAPTCRATGS